MRNTPPDHSMHPHVPDPTSKIGRKVDGRLLLTEVLGVGTYGVVYSAVDTESREKYAVKCISKYNMKGKRLSHQQTTRRLQEITLHTKASTHPNVVPVLRVIDEHDGIYVVMEHCPEGDLFWNICKRNQYAGNDQLCKAVFLQLLDALEHCHNLGIYHRDLKPENIMVAHQGWTVKLTDFGLATMNDISCEFGCGSSRYMSPECLRPDLDAERSYYSCAPNDVWALGIILINLTCAHHPWNQASDEDPSYRAFTETNNLLKEYLPLTSELNDILKEVFHPIPELRITIPELRRKILACVKFTVPTATRDAILTPPTTPSAPSSDLSIGSMPTVKHHH